MNLKAPSLIERRIDVEFGALVERLQVLGRHVAEDLDVIRELAARDAAIELRVWPQTPPGADELMRQPCARLQSSERLDQTVDVLPGVNVVQRGNVARPDSVTRAHLENLGRCQPL